MEAKVDPTSGFASIMQYCFPSALFGGDPLICNARNHNSSY